MSSCSRADWLWLIASTLACAEPSLLSGRRDLSLTSWPGLDFISLRDTARKAGLDGYTNAEAEKAMYAALRRKAEKGHCFFRAAYLGEKLQLTAAVRDELKIKTIDACDETREQRQERVKARRRERDREVKRTKRAAEGRSPRQQYEAVSLSRTKPWEAEGISRRTWERCRARDASMSAHVDRESDTNADTLATTGAEGSAGPCSALPASLHFAAAQASRPSRAWPVEPEPDRVLFLEFQNQKRNREPDEVRPGLPSEGASPKDPERSEGTRSGQPYRYPSRIRQPYPVRATSRPADSVIHVEVIGYVNAATRLNSVVDAERERARRKAAMRRHGERLRRLAEEGA
jgi:hypothetical protein